MAQFSLSKQANREAVTFILAIGMTVQVFVLGLAMRMFLVWEGALSIECKISYYDNDTGWKWSVLKM